MSHDTKIEQTYYECQVSTNCNVSCNGINKMATALLVGMKAFQSANGLRVINFDQIQDDCPHPEVLI